MTFRISDSLPNQITRFLTEKIISGDLKPGERIREAHLAHELGVSRAPIREALQALQRNRLVELNPRQGARVAPLSEQYVRWLYELLVELYSVVVRQMILNAGRDHIKMLDESLRKIEDISRAGNEEAYYDARFEYAQIGLDITDNQLLKEIIMDLVPSVMRVQHMALKQRVRRVKGTLAHLRAINDSIKKRNVEKGVQALRDLLARDMEFALQTMRESSP